MQTIRNLSTQTFWSITNNLQFFIHKNYIISISKGKNEVVFFNIKTFKKEFVLKPEIHEINFEHEQWKLIYTKEKQLFLIGYEHEYENELMDNKNKHKKLDIYLLKIEQKECVKKNSFIYYKFKDDEKEDKLYIMRDNEMLIYDLNKGTYNIKNLGFIEKFETPYWMNLYITSDYIIYCSFNMCTRWVFAFFYEVIDKNLDSGKECFCMELCGYDDQNDEYKYASNHHIQLSDNLFTVGSEIYNQQRILYFAEIKPKENFKPLEEDESIYFKENEIALKETGKINIFPINQEKCGIVCENKSYYIFNLLKMEINLKIEFDFKEKIVLLKFSDNNNKYKLYLTDKANKKLLYISS